MLQVETHKRLPLQVVAIRFQVQDLDLQLLQRFQNKLKGLKSSLDSLLQIHQHPTFYQLRLLKTFHLQLLSIMHLLEDLFSQLLELVVVLWLLYQLGKAHFSLPIILIHIHNLIIILPEFINPILDLDLLHLSLFNLRSTIHNMLRARMIL